MIIGVDAGSLCPPREDQKTGLYTYSANLLRALSVADRKNSYRLYTYAPLGKKFMDTLGPAFTNMIVRPKTFWSTVSLPAEMMKRKPDAYLGLSQYIPDFAPENSVMVLHDLAFLIFPGMYKNHARLRRITVSSAKKAGKIIAVSKSSRKDAVDLLRIPREKICVVYHGVDTVYRPQRKHKTEKILKKYGISTPYILFIGTLKPVKNVPMMIRAFDIFSKRSGGKNFSLVIAGSTTETDPEIFQVAKETDMKHVRFIPFISAFDLPALYSGASVFTSVALYEGFGLPLLEAMACGIPVVTSGNASMKEICGEYAQYADPQDPVSIACKITAALRMNNAEQSEKRIRYAGKFTWKQTAENTLRVLEG